MNTKITKFAKKMVQKSIYDDVKCLGKCDGQDSHEGEFLD
jgi:hypothetical protein